MASAQLDTYRTAYAAYKAQVDAQSAMFDLAMFPAMPTAPAHTPEIIAGEILTRRGSLSEAMPEIIQGLIDLNPDTYLESVNVHEAEETGATHVLRLYAYLLLLHEAESVTDICAMLRAWVSSQELLRYANPEASNEETA